MNVYLIKSVLLTATSFLAMMFGLVRVFPRTKGLYFRMGTMGIACLFVGYLSSLITYLTNSTIDKIANVSVLGSVGFSLFLLTQNADNISSVMYKPDKPDGKKVFLSLLPPLLIMATFIFIEIKAYNSISVHGFGFWFGYIGLTGVDALLSAITAFYTSYYSLAPDEELGLVNCLRPYNIVQTLLLILLIPERFLRSITEVTTDVSVMIAIYYALLAIGTLVVVPLMERGRLKFLTSL